MDEIVCLPCEPVPSVADETDDVPVAVASARGLLVSTPAALNTCLPCAPTYPPVRYERVESKFKCLWADDKGVCGKLYAGKQKVDTHWMTHTGEKPYKCNFAGCGKAFKTSSELTKHRRMHTGERPYKCDFGGCNASFSQKQTLIVHKRTHTGQKPYKCNFEGCGKAFAHARDLQLHVRRHTGEKPYKCDFEGCGATFVTSFTLSEHKRTHTNKRPFECTFPGCNATFKHKCSVAPHMRTHTGNRPFKCEICNAKLRTENPNTIEEKAFAQSSQLHEHMRIHHNPEYVARRRVQEEAVNGVLIDAGWKPHYDSETLPRPGFFKREHRIDFDCAAVRMGDEPAPKRRKGQKKKVDEVSHYCKIDFILNVGGIYVFLEVDEFQHRFGLRQGDAAALSCDAKRMSNVQVSMCIELGDQVPPVYWLRWNPHSWHIDGELVSGILKEERRERLVNFLAPPPTDGPTGRWVGHVALTTIGYAFYDRVDDTLDVLRSGEYNAELRPCVVDLGALESAASSSSSEASCSTDPL